MFSQISFVVVVFAVINAASGIDSDEIDLSKCSYLKSTGYGYSFYPIQQIENDSGIFLTFSVKAEKDALIIFSSTNKPVKDSQQVFEVVLGGYANTKSFIRNTPRSQNEIDTREEKNIISKSKWRQFWIRINSKGSSIEIGKNDSSAAFMSWRNESRPIKYYGFSSWAHQQPNEVEWAFQCGEKSNIIEDVSKCRAVNTDDYAYTFYPIEDIKNDNGIFLAFNVKAERDALIIFSPTNEPAKDGQNAFEVVLGGYKNEKSTIRVTPASGKEAYTHTEYNIVSPKEWRQFWIRIDSDGSFIEVGKHGRPAFMSLKNDSRPIKYYGFASWKDKNPVNWTFSCIENNSIDHCYSANSTTKKYHYQLFPIDYIKNDNGTFLNFSIKAERDALIIFSQTTEPQKEGQKVFEVVLGGKTNSYSMIRTNAAKDEVTGYNEKGILSSEEWRQFWIRTWPNGLIEVGNNGSSPFMSWNDSSRTNFTYFGFASWNDNVVNWTIHCPESNKMKNEKKLAQDLFTNYSQSMPPNGDTASLDQANIIIIIQNSVFSDPESVEISGLIKIMWKDSRLKWEPKSYSNVTTTNVDYGLIWKPNITIENNELANNTSLDSGNVAIFYNGSVSWTTPLHIKISCLPKGKSWKKSQLTCQMNSTYIASHFDLKVLHDPIPKNNDTVPFFFNKTQNLRNEEPTFSVELIYENQISKNLSKCIQLTSDNYQYKFYPINELKNESVVYLKFFVKGEQNAHIIFTSKNETVRTGEKAYEIVLGAQKNTRSAIRTSPTGINLYEHDMSNIISPDEWRQFWIRIGSDGLIQVGKNGSSEFMYLETEPMPIEYFGFASWKNGEIVNWAFECPDNIDASM